MIRILLLFAAAMAAVGQMRQNRIELIPATDNLSTGALDFNTLRGPSSYRVRLQGPASMTGNVDITVPNRLPAVNGLCIVGSTAGILDWGSCGGGVVVEPATYDWSQTITAPGAAGTHTITLTPGPLGVIAAETLPWYAISGGPGADEYVQLTGTGTCDGTGQASCTVQVVTANSHTSATTMRAVSDGMQEAILSAAASGEKLTLLFRADAGGFTIEKTVFSLGRSIHFKGEGWTASGSGSTIGVASGETGIYFSDGVLEISGLRMIGDGTTVPFELRASAANGSQAYIHDNWFDNHADAKIRTASDTYVFKNLFRNSAICLSAGNELWGDQGGLYIRNNYFGCSDKGIFLHEMGNTSIQHNSFLGSEYSIDADLRMVVVDTSGTTVTATSDYVFGTGLTTGVGVYINGTLYEIATRDSDTQLTLTTSAGTQTGVDLGIGSGQLQIQGNNFDNQEAGTIRIRGGVKFGNIDISKNHMQRVADTVAWDAASVTNENVYGLTFDGNTIDNFAAISNQTRGLYATALGPNFRAGGNIFTAMTYGMYLDLSSTDSGAAISGTTVDGVYVDPSNESASAITIINAVNASITNTVVRRHNRAIVIDGSSTSRVRVNHVTSECANPTDCAVVEVIDGDQVDITGVFGQNPVDYGVKVGASATAGGVRVSDVHINHAGGVRVSAAVATVIDDREGVTHANLPANAADGSQVYCTDCTFGASGCASGGTGAWAQRLNGVWSCPMGLESGQWILSSGNVYRSSGNVGIGVAPTSASLQIAKTGANNVLMSYGGGGHYSQWIQENGYTTFGTYSSSDLLFGTDSTNRWRLASVGILHPEADDTYDLGVLSGARIRGVYSKFVDTAKAGASGDSVRTRKLELFDNTGSSTAASFWDFNVVMSGAGAGQNSYFYLRDNGSANVFKAERISSGVAVDRTFWYTDILPDTANGQDLGNATYPWDEIHGASLTLSGTATITGNLSAAVINATGTPAYRVGGTTVIDASRAATFTGLTINTGAATVGYCWTATSTGGAGSWQACAGTALPADDTQTIVKGSSDASKLLRFEVDGFTTGTTRVLTPQNADYTIAGLSTTQTFTGTNTFSNVVNLNNGFSTDSNVILSSTRYLSNIVGASQNWLPTTTTTYTLGNSSYRWDKVWSREFDFSGGGTISGDAVFAGSTNTLSGTLRPGFDSLGSIGTSSYRYGTVYAYDADFADDVLVSGTLTASSAITANGGIATASGTNSTIYTGSGNFYLRTFSGGDASCSGVTDGWVGYRTDTNELQICDGGAVKKVTLL